MRLALALRPESNAWSTPILVDELNVGGFEGCGQQRHCTQTGAVSLPVPWCRISSDAQNTAQNTQFMMSVRRQISMIYLCKSVGWMVGATGIEPVTPAV